MSAATPAPAHATGDVYKDGVLAASLSRTGEMVRLAYLPAYIAAAGPPIASSLAVSDEVVEYDRLRLPPFFAGLLPEGETRRRDIQRAFHLAEDDELGLLLLLGADTIGDVQVVAQGEPAPGDAIDATPRHWEDVSFDQLWRQLPGPRTSSALPGVQPKMSAHSRSMTGGGAGPIILKFALPGWHAALTNERFFLQTARAVGLDAPDAQVVTDRDGKRALAVARFDRTVRNGRLQRHAQEDATQVMGLRPGQKYDPDAREVIQALASRCASPKLAARDLLHQMVYSYAIGNNDLHAKNLSIRSDPETRLWVVSPVYDVLHTWPYEGDHRFIPAIRPDGPHDSVTRTHWEALGRDIGLPEPLTRRLLDRVCRQVAAALPAASQAIDLPDARQRDLQRVIRKRLRDLQAP